MKRIRRTATQVAGVVALAGIATVLAVAVGEKVSVQVETATLRKTPSFLGKPAGSLKYTERVTVLERQDAWRRVGQAAGEAEGWLHKSAITEKKLLEAGNGEPVKPEASQEEVVLAGKGFNEETEEEYRKTTDVDFAPVDTIEQEIEPIDPERMQRFLEQGDVGPQGGAQ